MTKRRKRTNKKVPAKGRLRDMADALWAYAIKEDWLWECAVCGKNNVEAHHLIARENEATRYDLNNGIALCAEHHKFCPKLSAHNNCEAFRQWLAEQCPSRQQWHETTIRNGGYLSFAGTKNPAYYIEQIERLREYVPEKEFDRIVGVRFSAYLEEQRGNDAPSN